MKKYILPLLALILAVGMSAFTTTKHSESLQFDWYKLVGPDDTNPLDYEISNENPCDDPSGQRCGVYGMEDPNNPTHPDFDEAHLFTLKQ